MKATRRFLPFCVGMTLFVATFAQDFKAPPEKTPDQAALKQIDERMDKLRDSLSGLRRRSVPEAVRDEAEIFLKAAGWITQHKEFWHDDSAKWTLAALDQGLLRTSQLARGDVPWVHEKGNPVVRAYRSRIDGSLQPFAVTLPLEYGKDVTKRWRTDVVLHGRDATLNEVKFIHQHNGDQKAAKDQNYVQIDIYGRGNNAYRWAGETDVNEALDHFFAAEKSLNRLNLLDPNRVVLRGFSMGGAGAWHMGLHQPSRWCVVGPGAGFTTTHGYLKDLPAKLPLYQEACLHIYDAVDYAENAFNVPIVAYAGSEDEQLAAAKNIQAKLKPLDIPMTLLVGDHLAHSFPPEWQKKAEAEYRKHLEKGRPDYPEQVRFVTYTLKYPKCDWVNLIGLDRHYEKTLVDASHAESGFTLKTSNVRALRLDLPEGSTRRPMTVKVDGQDLEVRPYLSTAGAAFIYLEKSEGKWKDLLPELLYTDRQRHIQKMPGMQGPIDDAFTDGFLCVKGTGKPWNEAVQKFADDSLERFVAEWSKFFRGDLIVKNDDEVTPEDIANRHLILFGDPSSNSFIGQVLGALPLQWTKKEIKLAGQTVSATDHLPMMIYPSPLNFAHYVVLNSGHTFHAADFAGTNARLFPRLGDYALLKLAPGKDDPLAVEVITAGLFDDFWRVPKP